MVATNEYEIINYPVDYFFHELMIWLCWSLKKKKGNDFKLKLQKMHNIGLWFNATELHNILWPFWSCTQQILNVWRRLKQTIKLTTVYWKSPNIPCNGYLFLIQVYFRVKLVLLLPKKKSSTITLISSYYSQLQNLFCCLTPGSGLT